MNAATLAALSRWHFGRLGAAAALAAAGLGLLFGAVCAWSRTPEAIAVLQAAVAGSAVAVAFAASGKSAATLRSLFLFSAPLYGRELARGLALAPCLLAALFPLAAYAGFALLCESHAGHWLASLFAPLLATLVALSATLREGWRAALYRTLGFASAALLAAVGFVGGVTPPELAAVGALACGAGFVALRAFGETLARYDPIADV